MVNFETHRRVSDNGIECPLVAKFVNNLMEIIPLNYLEVCEVFF